MLHKNFICWNQFNVFHFVWKFTSAWKSISHCKFLKLFDFTLFFVYTLQLLKAPLAHIFALFWNTYDLLQSVRFQGGSLAFKQSNAKTKYESLRGASRHLWKKGAPRRPPRSAPIISAISTPALNYIRKKELASFYNTIELTKVLCNVIKIFFCHSVMLRIT